MNEAPPAARVAFRRVDGRARLADLWVFTGSVCNLKCLHCYTGSSPANRTLEAPARAAVAAVLAEALGLGVAHVYFTGGEPFLHPEIVGLLGDALAAAPTTVLTNATEPLARNLDALAALRRTHGDRLAFRVSLDHTDAERHDAIRRDGAGAIRDAFETTVATTVRLAALGVVPIVTLTAEVFRGNPVPPAAVIRQVQALFAARGARVDVKILPAVLDQGAQRTRRDRAPAGGPVTEADLAASGISGESLMCHASRCVAWRAGRPVVFPCPILVPADAASGDELAPFELGPSLTASLTRDVSLAHPSCGAYCVRAGGTCGDR